MDIQRLLTASQQADKPALAKAVAEALLSLGAIGHPEPNDPPDGHVCGVIARSALIRIVNALETV